jgi:hypothetical protein
MRREGFGLKGITGTIKNIPCPHAAFGCVGTSQSFLFNPSKFELQTEDGAYISDTRRRVFSKEFLNDLGIDRLRHNSKAGTQAKGVLVA